MANSPDPSNSSPASDAPKRGLFSRKPKEAKAKKPSRLKQIGEVFQMTRRHDPMVPWLMLLAFLGVVAVSLLVGFLLDNWITGLIIGIALGALAATLILSRRAERAAFAQIENQPGASGAALGTLKRGWITEDQPVAVNPRTQDAVFRAIGRPGVVLVSEGPSNRVKPLVDAERKRLARILPNVTIHVIESGRGEGQVPLSQIARKMNKLKGELTKTEVSAVSKRISSLGGRLPIPKGIDPYKARPDRKRPADARRAAVPHAQTELPAVQNRPGSRPPQAASRGVSFTARLGRDAGQPGHDAIPDSAPPDARTQENRMKLPSTATMIRIFRGLAIAEAFSWAALLLGMVLKWITRTTELGVEIAGPIHGAFFIGYAIAALSLWANAALAVPGCLALRALRRLPLRDGLV